MSGDRHVKKYSHNLSVVTHVGGIYLEHHTPQTDPENYHLHPSLEMNFLTDCSMIYSFGHERIEVPSNRVCAFWAARPHSVYAVQGVGKITNAYVPLQIFWNWHLPQTFLDALFSGKFLVSKAEMPDDQILMKRLAKQKDTTDEDRKNLVVLEVQARLTRMALDGWHALGTGVEEVETNRIGGKAVTYLERMLRFVSIRYSDQITLRDIARSAGITQNYAILLFRRMLGTTIKAHLTHIRISHAKLLLSYQDRKIFMIALDCGFQSQSAFYEAFKRATGTTPAEFRDRLQE